MNKNELRFIKENKLAKNEKTIKQSMLMMYHDLSYHRKNSLLHAYNVTNDLLHEDTPNSHRGYILYSRFDTQAYTVAVKPKLIHILTKLLNSYHHDLSQDKAHHEIKNQFAKAINKISQEHSQDEDTRLVQDRLSRVLKTFGSSYSVKFDNNNIHLLKHEIHVLSNHDFNTTLYTYNPRTAISEFNPVLRKPTCNPKIEYSRLTKFEGLSKYKANKIIKLDQFKANLNVDFRPTTYSDLRDSLKSWLRFN